MKTEIITTWNQLSALEDEWNGLLRSSRADSIFLTWEWIQAWRSVVGEDTALFVVTVRNTDNELVGIAPFYRYRLKLLNLISYTGLRILADYSTGHEYGDWIVHRDDENSVLQAIADELLKNKNQWDLIWMPKMSGWSNSLKRITDAANNAGLRHQSRESRFSNIPLPSAPEQFEASFASKRRQQLRRHKRKLLNKPGVEIERCENAEQLNDYIEILFELHYKRRMLLKDSGAFMRRPAEAAFYRAFTALALTQGWLRFYALKQDDNIEAIQIGYAYNGEFLQLQEGFNPNYVDGAGNVLRHVVIEESIKEGLKNYDFLGGFSEHKRRWGAVERKGHDLLLGHASLKNRLLFKAKAWPSGRHITEIGLYDGN